MDTSIVSRSSIHHNGYPHTSGGGGMTSQEAAGPGASRRPDGPAGVDVHAHALPMPLLRYLADHGRRARAQAGSGPLRLDPSVSAIAKGACIPLPAERYDVPRRLAAMDAAGIDLQHVSAPPFVFGSTSEDDELVMAVTRRSNDA